jgi:hypothetical protein
MLRPASRSREGRRRRAITAYAGLVRPVLAVSLIYLRRRSDSRTAPSSAKAVGRLRDRERLSWS